MKYLNLLSAALLISAVACTEEELADNLSNNSGEMREISIEASTMNLETGNEISGVETRTMMREGGEVYWNANDVLGVFTSKGELKDFKTDNGGKVTRFTGLNDVEDEFYLFYPYNEKATVDENGIISTFLSATQYPEPGSFYNGGSLSVSKNKEGQTAVFHQVCSYFRMSISEDYAGEITGLIFEGNDGESLAGKVTINMESEEYKAVIDESEPVSNRLVMTTEDHLYQGKYYYFVLPAQTFVNGFTLTFVNKDGLTWKRVYDKSITFTVNTPISMSNVIPGTFEYGEDFVEDNCYYVHTLDGLYDWAERVNGGEYTLNCQLMASFDFDKDSKNRKWTPVGTKEHPYEGQFNGNGRELRHLRVDGDYECAGFFGALGPVQGREEVEVKVSNVKIINPSIRSSHVGDENNPDDDGYVGVIAGMMNYEFGDNHSGAVIDKCDVTEAMVSGGENVGGILGRSYGGADVISRCNFQGEVRGAMFLGGIVGNVEGDVVDCHSHNAVIKQNDKRYEVRSGGIVGTNNGDILVSSANDVDVSTDGRYAGGIAGANNGIIVGCVAYGKATATFSGGIAGESFGAIKASYANCEAEAGVVYRIKTDILDDFKACFTTVKGLNPVVSPEAHYNLWYAPYIQLKKDELNEVLQQTEFHTHNIPGSFNGAHWEYQQSIDEYAEYLPIRPVKITKDEN
ncbi:fimbrillin family protein [Parabacteroides johnsonii]|uniref:fimbrillin family protein n=1 Tax=Parabacteroides johnsonii TaxID=387661 RepID=UPI00267127EE|nr:fimbrillin family protein [Parabacteroides johnsonii]